jgi:hypothetical protein
MFPRVSTEVEGWRDALSDRPTVLTLAGRLVSAALCAAAGVVGSRTAEPYAVVLGTTLVVLGYSLVRLRATGRA